uniref:Uncharacterized protein n=1 Tax=Panagrolaimus sp. ES5 TaxID=591445 RepID=A0AC34GB32_9BILA
MDGALAKNLYFTVITLKVFIVKWTGASTSADLGDSSKHSIFECGSVGPKEIAHAILIMCVFNIYIESHVFRKGSRLIFLHYENTINFFLWKLIKGR